MATRNDEAVVARPEAGGHESELAYQPALDGVRAIGVLSVLLYHAGVGWAQGGFLGVEAFFVLSGFLITSLLVAEWHRHSTIKLSNFWGRRARRLLPALFAVVLVVGVYQAVAGASKAVPDLLPDGLATLAYIGNWHQIWAGTNYFGNTGPQSPFLHTWSLAIEEQFYLIWPLVVLGILALGRRRSALGRRRSALGRRRSALGRRRSGRSAAPSATDPRSGQRRRLTVLFLLAVIGALASAVEMGILYTGPSQVNRVYYGTDTRAQGLLAGAALAFGLALWRGREAKRTDSPATATAPTHATKPTAATTPTTRSVPGLRGVALAALGVAGLAGVLYGMHAAGVAGGMSPVLYRGGMLAFDAAALAVIASAVLAPRAVVGRLLAVWPMRSIGKISYGLYMWHWPLFLWMTQQTTGLSGFALFSSRIGASFAVAIASYFLIEQPVRQRRWPMRIVWSLAPVSVGAAVTALVVATTVSPAIAAGSRSFKPTAGTTTTIVLPPSAVSWAGTQPTCEVYQALPNARAFPPVRYHTCPPVHVELLGDSMAVTLGFGLGAEQTRYGILMSDSAELGCSFGTRGTGNWYGTGFLAQYAPCLTIFKTWHRETEAFRAAAVVVMMGYWDCYDRDWNGHDEHLGERVFDAYVFSRMEAFVRAVGVGGLPIVMLTVPWADPPPQANGSPQPAASAARHDEINRLLEQLAAKYPQVHLVDTDKWISPGNHFDATLNGKPCRWSDGVHFYPYCGAVLAPHVLPLVRQLVQARGGPGPSGAPGLSKIQQRVPAG